MMISRARATARSALTAAVAIALLGIGLAGCSNSRADSASTAASSACDLGAYTKAKIDWKQFSGKTITVAAEANPWWSAVEPQLTCFTKLTGITVKPSVLGEDQYVSHIAVELSAGSSTPDVYMINQFGQATGSHWLEPLDSYLANPKLTDPAWYDTKDYFPGAFSFAHAGGKLMAVPVTAEVQMLYLRTDLVHAVPTTMDQLVAAARSATTGGVSGFSSRAVASASESPWPFAGFAFSEGGRYLDENGKPDFDSAQNIKALQTYATLIKHDGPAGASGWGFQQNQQAMQQGTLAMWSDSSSLLASLKDPKTSRYAKDIQAYPFPAGTAGSVPNVYYWTVGINAASAQKDASWLFLQWASSAPMSQQEVKVGASPARASAWKLPAASATIGKGNADRIQKSLENVDSTDFAEAWTNTQWGKLSDPLARAINAAVSGTDPATALKAAQKTALGMLK